MVHINIPVIVGERLQDSNYSFINTNSDDESEKKQIRTRVRLLTSPTLYQAACVSATSTALYQAVCKC